MRSAVKCQGTLLACTEYSGATFNGNAPGPWAADSSVWGCCWQRCGARSDWCAVDLGYNSVMAPDGDRSYGYLLRQQFSDPDTIAVHDLAASPDPETGKFPPLGLLTLDPAINPVGVPGVPVLAISADGKTLFAWGSAAIQVIPLL